MLSNIPAVDIERIASTLRSQEQGFQVPITEEEILGLIEKGIYRRFKPEISAVRSLTD